MTIKYDNIAYCAYVKNGKVNYEKEYYKIDYPCNKIVYIEKIKQKEYAAYVNDIEKR